MKEIISFQSYSFDKQHDLPFEIKIRMKSILESVWVRISCKLIAQTKAISFKIEKNDKITYW